MDKANITQGLSEQKPQHITTPPQAHLKCPTTKSAESTTNSFSSHLERPRTASLWQPSAATSTFIIENSSGFGQPATGNIPPKDGLWSPSNSKKVTVPKELVEAAERDMEVRRRYHEDEEELVKKQ